MNVTVLGAGTIGAALATNLQGAGHATTVWDRSPARSMPLALRGAYVAPTPVAAVADADVMITMLADDDAVTSVVQQGVLSALPMGAVWAQMGTIGLPTTEQMLAVAAARRPDVLFVDAPVIGGQAEAEHSDLVVLASGPSGAAERLDPVFSALGHTVWLGEAGRGSQLRLVVTSWLDDED